MTGPVTGAVSTPPWLFAWTPPGCGSVASVGLRAVPDGPFTRHGYRSALIDRIDRLVAAEPAREARRLLNAAYVYEGLDATDHLAVAGELLVENSDRVYELCSFPDALVTLTADDHDDDALCHLLEDDTLQGFIRQLYPEF